MALPEVVNRWQSQRVADSYDAERFQGLLGRWFDRAQRRALGRCLARLGALEWLVDVPCGTGRMLPVWSMAGARCVAVDISRAMIGKAQCRVRGEGVLFTCADAKSLPIADNGVDGVVSVRFLMHLSAEQRVAVLREFGRVASRWVVVEYGLESPWHKVRRTLRAAVLRMIGKRRTYPQATTWRQIHAEAQKAGLAVQACHWTARVLSQSVFVVMRVADPVGSKG